MALLFMDGFDHYNTNSLMIDKGYTYANVSVFGVTAARFSGGGVFFQSDSNYFLKDLGVNKSTIYMGIAIKKSEFTAPSPSPLFGFIKFFDESQVRQIDLVMNADHSITVYRNGTSLGSSAADSFLNQKWQFLEIKIVISDTVGEVEILINGTQILNLTSQDTKNGSDYIRYIEIRSIRSNGDVLLDDFYIDDAQFHGDCRIRAFMPDLDGNSADFTRSTGANDYECVDESPSNEDTDYISSDTLNHKSIFGITTGAVGTVKGVQVNNHVRIDEAGTRKIKPIIRSNATDYQGTETDLITADYLFEHEVWELDPDDSGAWTQTKLEAAEFGLEITT